MYVNHDVGLSCIQLRASNRQSKPSVGTARSRYSLLLGSVLLTECCRTDDLLPDLPVPCLPPCRVDSKVLGLIVIVDRSQPGGSWTPHGSPLVRWRSQCGGDDTVMVFLLSWPNQVAEELQPRACYNFRDWRTACDAPNCSGIQVQDDHKTSLHLITGSWKGCMHACCIRTSVHVLST